MLPFFLPSKVKVSRSLFPAAPSPLYQLLSPLGLLLTPGISSLIQITNGYFRPSLTLAQIMNVSAYSVFYTFYLPCFKVYTILTLTAILRGHFS